MLLIGFLNVEISDEKYEMKNYAQEKINNI